MIPTGKADVILAMEPVEGLRVLEYYANPDITALVNTRPIYPVDMTAGDETYPHLEEIKETLKKLCGKVWFINATEKAVQLGSRVLVNMIMIGDLLHLKLFPLSEEEFREALSKRFTGRRLAINIQALEQGMSMLQKR